MSIMEQQMQDQIEGGLHRQEQFFLSIVRVRSILGTMKVPFYYDTDKKLLKNIKWYYRNLHVHNRRHENYIEAIDLIESIMNEA